MGRPVSAGSGAFIENPVKTVEFAAQRVACDTLPARWEPRPVRDGIARTTPDRARAFAQNRRIDLTYFPGAFSHGNDDNR